MSPLIAPSPLIARLSVSTVSEVLSGKRRSNVKHMEALARSFKVEPAVFLDD
jgi:antitoxin component HigA of HigAB toxin-antitoxin module